MIESIDLLGFLTFGLVGGFWHCVGMCSPFVLLLSRCLFVVSAFR